MSYILSIITSLLLSAKISKAAESRRVGYLEGSDVRAICYPSGRIFIHHSSWPSNYEVRQTDLEAFFSAMKITPVKPVKETILWTPPTGIEPTRVEAEPKTLKARLKAARK